MSKPDLQPHAYVLAVRDLAGSTRYFTDVLGFTKEWNDGDNWQALMRGSVRLMLGRCPDALPPAELGDHSYFGFSPPAMSTRCTPSSRPGARLSAHNPPTSHGAGERWRWRRPRATG